MSQPPRSENGALVEGIAVRLRTIQEQYRGDPQLLKEYLARVTRDMPPEAKADFLEKLAQQFPTFGTVLNTAPAPTPEQMVEELRKLAGSSERERARVLELLTRAGLIQQPPPFPDWFPRGLRGKLQMSERLPVEPSRALDLALLGTELAVWLDEHVWRIWRQFDRDANQPQNLKELQIRFLGIGEGDKARKEYTEKVSPHLSTLRKRLTVLTAALRAFTQRWADRFTPSELEQISSAGPFGKHKAYWEKYVELCGGADRENLVNEMDRTMSEVIREIYESTKS